MPTFPTYHGELSKCLNPLNLRHYFLLAYWVFFRPTALKCYLYQADPDLYRTGPGVGIFRTWGRPTYRNLYLMMPGTIVLLSLLAGVPMLLWLIWFSNVQIGILGWATGIVVGTMIGIVFGSVGGTILGLAGSAALSMVGGVMGGVAFGTTGALAVGVVTSAVVDAAVGEMFRVVIGAALGIAFSVAFGAMGGVLTSTAGSVALSAALSLLSRQMAFFAIAGASHAILYPFQLALSLRSALGKGKHPLEWDELTPLPLPGTRQALLRRLTDDRTKGLCLLLNAARNPFQRWVAQAALQLHLHHLSSPLQFLYALPAHDDLGEYVYAPVRDEDWKHQPSTGQLLLGELDVRWVNCGSDWPTRLAERVVWIVTWPLRDRRKTPLTRFAGMLYELVDEETVKAEEFDLSIYADIYTGLTDYPGGEEIARTFEAMATFLSYDNIAALPAATTKRERDQVLEAAEPIRPTVITALNSLVQIGAEVGTYRVATSRVNQLAALARAANALDALDDDVIAQVMAPEQTILLRIIRQWRRLISEAGGEVGRAEEIGPVANPYVAGNPVTGHLFVGRQDILRRLEELWIGEGQKPSVILYGHRRMGKSSILHNLGARFGTQAIIADFNMQRVGLVGSTGELLYNLALSLYDSLPPAAREGLEGGEPDEERFTHHNPYTAFDRFLKRLDRVREAHRFFVTVDEFELIEALIAEGKLEPHLLDFWRGVIQTYPWSVMTFAGLHTLQEMTRDYWHPLFGSVIGIPVSFLSYEAAVRLITQPTPDFPLDYDQDAIDYIFTLTNGQPYLIQLIGHGLVTRFNHQTYEEGIERERRFSLADIRAVINAPEFYRDGDAYFTGVWRQAETSAPPGQTLVLHALAQSGAGMEVEEVASRTHLSPQEITAALATLARHDVVVEANDGWRFTVELMHRWVENQGSGRNAMTSRY
jgi:hypothetical protein